MAERPHDPDPGHPAVDSFAAANGWDREYEVYSDFELPTYVGPTTFMNLPWITDPIQLLARNVDVAIIGAPFDDAVSHRSGARFGPRAIREAQYTSGSINSLQLVKAFFQIIGARIDSRRRVIGPPHVLAGIAVRCGQLRILRHPIFPIGIKLRTQCLTRAIVVV